MLVELTEPKPDVEARRAATATDAERKALPKAARAPAHRRKKHPRRRRVHATSASHTHTPTQRRDEKTTQRTNNK